MAILEGRSGRKKKLLLGRLKRGNQERRCEGEEG